MTTFKKHETWSSRTTFLMAAVGGAIGLGNIWKFPYIMGENGGSAFVLVYLLCIMFVAIPILVAEIMLGRSSQKSKTRGRFIESRSISLRRSGAKGTRHSSAGLQGSAPDSQEAGSEA